MKQIKFLNYTRYVKAQQRSATRRGRQAYFTAAEIGKIAEWLKARQGSTKQGICHGARNGIEADVFKRHFKADVIGTDLFPYWKRSAIYSSQSIVHKHDFSVEKEDWIGMFDFVYSNSLDHARNPKQTLGVWLRQLKPEGYLFLQWHPGHIDTGGGDCFGAYLHEYFNLVNSVGRVEDLIYCKSKWVKENPLQRRFFEVVVIVANQTKEKEDG